VPRIVPSDGVVCAELDGEAVVLDVERGIYFGLDEIAFRIWTLLSAGQDADAIAARLSDEYNAPPAEIRTDVDDFLEALVARGLARRTAPAPAGTKSPR
jgi:hypothetical protein